MKQLTIEDILEYLPYGVRSKYLLSDVSPYAPFEIREKILSHDSAGFVLKYCKPLLHPMERVFDKIIEVDGEKKSFIEILWTYNSNIRFCPKGTLSIIEHGYREEYLHYTFYPYWIIEQAAKHHFDFKNLIGQGLAEPIKL